jgi:hypothetical protein
VGGTDRAPWFAYHACLGFCRMICESLGFLQVQRVVRDMGIVNAPNGLGSSGTRWNGVKKLVNTVVSTFANLWYFLDVSVFDGRQGS